MMFLIRKRLSVAFSICWMAVLAGCYPATIYKPVAAGATSPSAACAGLEGYLFVNRGGLRLAFHATDESGKFFVYISAGKPMSPVQGNLASPIKTNLSEFVLLDQNSLERFKPIAYDRLQYRGTVFVRTEVFPVDPAFTFEGRSTNVRIGFPGEVAERNHLFLLAPKFIIGGISVPIPDIEFIKTTEVRSPALDCDME
ncbi:MAG TPA: hypothetical protein VMN77_04325 [Nitrospiria bacterium]|jgi:hypothetical protein|nr:hypothetical protein [Nitrospiria bacterium]